MEVAVLFGYYDASNKLMGNIRFGITCVLGGYFVITGRMLVGEIQAFGS